MNYRLLNCDVLDGLAQLGSESVQCVVSSPPYCGLRDYGVPGQIGLEAAPEEWCARLVDAFREVRRVLSGDGVVWLNVGDSYAGSGRGSGGTYELSAKQNTNRGANFAQGSQLPACLHETARESGAVGRAWAKAPAGYKQKDLIGAPWMLAFALRADGWYLRSDIIWSKPNPMPESVADRPTKAHEYLFLLSKSRTYFYDADAIAEPASVASIERWAQDVDAQQGSIRAHAGGKTNGTMKAVGGPRKADRQRGHSRRHAGFNDRWDAMERTEQCGGMRNKRSVWTIATEPFPEAHFATFPTALVEPCILAGSRVGDTILDPFSGSGTTGVVALAHQRNYVGIELNPLYVEMSRRRLQEVAPMFTSEVTHEENR